MLNKTPRRRTQKPYMYMLRGRNGGLQKYSGAFATKPEALEWYRTKGKLLEKTLGRELVLHYSKPENRSYVVEEQK